MSEMIAFIAIGVLVLAIMGWLIFLTAKYRKLMNAASIIFEGESSKKLSKMIEDYFEAIHYVNKSHKKLETIIKKTGELADLSLSKMALLRYNPFGDVGSDQSFSLCLLNTNNDGFIISSIHSRDGTRVYSKPVKAGESSYNLSKEEEKAIKLAINNN